MQIKILMISALEIRINYSASDRESSVLVQATNCETVNISRLLITGIREIKKKIMENIFHDFHN